MYQKSGISNIGGASGSSVIFTYLTTDAKATVLSAGYFNKGYTELKKDDLVFVVLSGDQFTLRVNQSIANNVVLNEVSIGEVANNARFGFADYNDLATSTTPLPITTANNPNPLSNDALGAQTNISFLPSGVTKLWNSTTNRFDLSELPLGSTVDIRLDIDLIMPSPNTEVSIVLELGSGAGRYDITYLSGEDFKDAATHKVTLFNSFYIADSNTKDGGGVFSIITDKTFSVKVNGWYCRVILP